MPAQSRGYQDSFQFQMNFNNNELEKKRDSFEDVSEINITKILKDLTWKAEPKEFTTNRSTECPCG